MPFVKLDTGILDSTLWIERECREIFITALLMAEPREFLQPQQQIAVGSLEYTGFEAPPGWYGFVPAASYGIINRALVDRAVGLAALEKLGSPEVESRSKEFDGRRLIRIDGGFLVLNFMKYRDRDYTGAERAKRYRERKKYKTITRDVHEVTRDEPSLSRDVTQAECRVQSAEAEKDNSTVIGPEMVARSVMETCSISGRFLLNNLADVCRSRMKAGDDPEWLRDKMCSAWKEYDALRDGFSVSAEKFFGEGLWNNKTAWKKETGNGRQSENKRRVQRALEEIDREEAGADGGFAGDHGS